MFKIGDKVEIIDIECPYGKWSGTGVVVEMDDYRQDKHFANIGVELDFWNNGGGNCGHNCGGTTSNGRTRYLDKGWYFAPINLKLDEKIIRAEKLLNGELDDVESEYPKNFLDEIHEIIKRSQRINSIYGTQMNARPLLHEFEVGDYNV